MSASEFSGDSAGNGQDTGHGAQSLFERIISLMLESKFPVNDFREFGCKPLLSLPVSVRNAHNSAYFVIFPCIFPVNREFMAETG